MKVNTLFLSLATAGALALGGSALACDSCPAHAKQAQPGKSAPQKEAPAKDTAKKAKIKKAVVGMKAPNFELVDLDGKKHKLSDYSGKIVVLEWYNPDCPFVKWAHNTGPLKDMAARYTAKGVQWLAINSGAAGKQGHGLARNLASLKEYSLSHPIALDESGAVGKAYGATNTPQLYIIDKAGVLVYAGA